MPVTFIQSGRFGAGGYSFTNAEAAALVARMSSAPNDTRKGHIDTLVGALKTNGTWTKRRGLYLFAAHDSQSALLNWISTDFDATAVNSPTFTTDRGFTSASTKSIESGFNPTTASSPLYTQNSAHLMVWSRTPGDTAPSVYAVEYGSSLRAFILPNQFINPGSGFDYYTGGQINASGSGEVIYPSSSSTFGRGLFTLVRRGSTTNGGELYKDAATLLTSGFATSSALNSDTITFANGWVGEIALGSFGEALSDAEVSADYTAIQAYMTAVGA